MSKVYRDYKELLDDREQVAKELLEEVGSGDWQNNSIYLYNDTKDFAEYELTDGWYADAGFGDSDYNGAPNPMDFIDLKAFGEDLSNSWDESCHFLSSNGTVLQTSHGW